MTNNHTSLNRRIDTLLETIQQRQAKQNIGHNVIFYMPLDGRFEDQAAYHDALMTAQPEVQEKYEQLRASGQTIFLLPKKRPLNNTEVNTYDNHQ